MKPAFVYKCVVVWCFVSFVLDRGTVDVMGVLCVHSQTGGWLFPYKITAMPTALDRVQCLLQPSVYAQVSTLSKHNRRTKSAMCAELIAHALQTPTYKAQLEEAEILVPPKPDPRIATPQTQFKADVIAAAVEGVDITDAKIKKLMALMELLGDD